MYETYKDLIVNDERLDQFWRLKMFGMLLFKKFRESDLSKRKIFNIAWDVFDQYFQQLDG